MSTTYAFDPTGTNPANRVALEQHVITAVNFRDFNYVIPNLAPFFESNISISFRDVNNNPRTLVNGVDYYFTHQFIGASKACAAPIYGSICFVDSSIAGVIQISYNTVGGIWTLNQTEIASILADNLFNPRITAWEQITNLPISFPVIDHEWNLTDLVGASELVASVDAIRDAILANTGGGIAAHTSNLNNPHSTTKAQVGLGNVENYPIATTQQAQAGLINTAYMTPALVKLVVDASTNADIANHTANLNNPHSTTKAQIGLGNVDNYVTATTAVALIGSSITSFMTPASTRAVIDSINLPNVNHIANISNPHSTTAAQIGLGSVQNYPIASIPEAQAGTSTNTYMTPVRVSQAITALALTPLNSHIADQANPHATTATQVGLSNVANYAIATLLDAQQVTSNTTYMTPLRTAQTISQLTTQILSSHATRVDNPHTVTKAQVGLGNVANYAVATNVEAIAGVSATTYMTPVATKAVIDSLNYYEPPGDIVFSASPTQSPKTQRILIQGQAISLAAFPSLSFLYCGDAANTNADPLLQADFFYRCTDPANPNTTRSTTGNYLVLPPAGYFLRPLNTGSIGADANRNRFKLQADALQDFRLSNIARATTSGALNQTNIYRSQNGTSYNSGPAYNVSDAVIYNIDSSVAGFTDIVPVNANIANETRTKNWPVYVWMCY